MPLSGTCQQNCESPEASGHLLSKNGLQDEPIWPLLEFKLHKNIKDSTYVLRFLICSGVSNATLFDPSGSYQQNCKSPLASGHFLVKNGLQDESSWLFLELKLSKIRPDATCVFRLLTCSRLSNATLVDPSGSCQQNCKSPRASGHSLVKNGLQDEPKRAPREPERGRRGPREPQESSN